MHLNWVKLVIIIESIELNCEKSTIEIVWLMVYTYIADISTVMDLYDFILILVKLYEVQAIDMNISCILSVLSVRRRRAPRLAFSALIFLIQTNRFSGVYLEYWNSAAEFENELDRQLCNGNYPKIDP